MLSVHHLKGVCALRVSDPELEPKSNWVELHFASTYGETTSLTLYFDEGRIPAAKALHEAINRAYDETIGDLEVHK